MRSDKIHYVYLYDSMGSLLEYQRHHFANYRFTSLGRICMKLKNKLAKDAVKQYVDSHQKIVVYDMAQVIYLAGFEKCREMAIEKTSDWVGEDHYLIKYDLPQLGEVEVK